MSRVVGIDHIAVRVSDFPKSKAFYGGLFDFLGFEVLDEYEDSIGWTNGKTRYWISLADADGSTNTAPAMSVFTIMHSSCATERTLMICKTI
ncbi:VOC family protein [Hyphomicrobium sp. 2TAF46]|uniref:VOC family protein n=1 Tax=Hyphomicrobium sp. 2TAF46 TaxID=3233019 RepID=UPI003F93C400